VRSIAFPPAQPQKNCVVRWRSLSSRSVGQSAHSWIDLVTADVFFGALAPIWLLLAAAIMELAKSLGWDVENNEQDDQPEFYVISPELSDPFTKETFDALRDEIYSDLGRILHPEPNAPVNDPPDGKRARIQADTDQIAHQIVHDTAFVANLAAMVGDLLSTRAAPASTAPPPAATHAPDSIEDRLEYLERLVRDAGLGDFRPDYRDRGMLDDAIIAPTLPPP
jgi:hypothetical protein